ncbi:hypothetical protein L204_103416 [Cryptococcus depauperatus]|nr:hypothetical protein L204_01729 [Cryptococcus depauperatus CBS 7855]
MAQPSQAEIISAFASQSAIPRTTPTIPFSSLSTPLLELTNVLSVDGLEERVNSRKLYCPRDGCGSVALRAGLGRWVESSGHGLPQDPSSPFPASQAYWHVPNGPFEFDNIGFSRPVADFTLPQYAPGSCEKGRVKWLICADCDFGPIGWSCEGEKDAWLAVDRVRYGKDETEGKK